MRYFLIFYISLMGVSPALALSFHAPKSDKERYEFQLAEKYLSKIKEINNDLEDNKNKKKSLKLYS